MVRVLQSSAACSPSAKDDSYVYKIVPCGGGRIGGITSSDELFLVDASNLASATPFYFAQPPKQLSTLVATDDRQTLICAGGEDILLYDIRTQERIAAVKAGKTVTALACSGSRLAVGTEYIQHQAIVSVWDLRQSAKAQWQNAENHDDITALDFQASNANNVLAGGDDGQVSIFDCTIAEEQDSLIQGFTHGPIHKAGFLDQNSIYALSSDQDLALHPVFDDSRAEEPAPFQLGDLRPKIPCEYVIDVLPTGGESVIAAGSHSKSQVDIVAIHAGGSLELNDRIVLEGAHGEEIVRSIVINNQDGVIFTAGEDGRIQAFRIAGKPQKSASKPKKSSSSSGRYQPY